MTLLKAHIHQVCTPLAFLFALAFLPSEVHGQRTSKPTVEVSVCSLIPLPKVEFYCPTPAGGQQRLGIAYRSRGDFHRVVGDTALPVFRKSEDAAGEVIWTPALTLTLNPELPLQTVLIYQDSNGSVRSFAVPAHPSQHPAGTAMMVNLCGTRIATKFGEETNVLSDKGFSLRPMSVGQFYDFTFAYQLPNGRMSKDTNSRFRIKEESQRMLLVISASQVSADPKNPVYRPKLTILYDKIKEPQNEGSR